MSKPYLVCTATVMIKFGYQHLKFTRNCRYSITYYLCLHPERKALLNAPCPSVSVCLVPASSSRMVMPKKVQSVASVLCANLYDTSSPTERTSDDQRISDFYEFLLQSST